MQLSPNTLTIIKNFVAAPFLTSLVIPGGKVLSTFEQNRQIIAIAEIEDEFPREAIIYDAPRFLSVISLINQPDFQWNDDHVVVSSADRSQNVRWRYAAKDLMPATPPVEFTPIDSIASFIITKDQLTSCLRAAAALGHEAISFQHEDGSVRLTTIDPEVVTHINGVVGGAAAYSLQLGIEDSKVDGWAHDYGTRFLDTALPVDYRASISRKGGLQLTSMDNSGFRITYRIGQNAKRNR